MHFFSRVLSLQLEGESEHQKSKDEQCDQDSKLEIIQSLAFCHWGLCQDVIGVTVEDGLVKHRWL